MDKSVFERADLQQLCSFILFQEETTTQTGSYEERIEKAKKCAYKELKNALDDEAIEDTLSEVFGTYQTIYTEIGIKLGAEIMLQLLPQR